MKLTRKRFEHLAATYCRRFTRTWEYYILASDAYINGYRQGIEDYKNGKHLEQVEVELSEGEQQLSVATFEKWEKERV